MWTSPTTSMAARLSNHYLTSESPVASIRQFASHAPEKVQEPMWSHPSQYTSGCALGNIGIAYVCTHEIPKRQSYRPMSDMRLEDMDLLTPQRHAETYE